MSNAYLVTLIGTSYMHILQNRHVSNLPLLLPIFLSW